MPETRARVTRRHANTLAAAAFAGLADACTELAATPTPTAAPSSAPAARPGTPMPPDRPTRPRGTIVQAMYADARTLNPVLARDPASAAFASLHFNAPLLRRNPVSLDWDASEGTAGAVVLGDGGRSITYVLREGLSWSDGAPITAADYRFTYERMADPTAGHPYQVVYRDVESVETPDDRTITWTFREPFCPALDFTVINPIPRHVFGGNDLSGPTASDVASIGSGPYLLRDWRPGASATFEANDRFYLGRPRADRIVVRLVADASEGWALVKAGEADLAVIRASDFREAASMPGTAIERHYPATSAWTYLGLNLRHPALADLRVRRAFAHAVDRAALVREVRAGHARLIDSPLGRDSWASAAVPSINHDPAAARRLLDEAGWIPSQAGVRHRANDELRFTLHFPTGSQERERVAAMVAADLRSVGAAIDLAPEPLADLVDRVTVTREYDLCVLGWTMPHEPHGTRDVWASTGALNGSGLADPMIDALYDEAARVAGCGRDVRARAYADVQRRIADAVPCVFLFENESLVARSDRLSVNPMTRLGWDYRPWEWSLHD